VGGKEKERPAEKKSPKIKSLQPGSSAAENSKNRCQQKLEGDRGGGSKKEKDLARPQLGFPSPETTNIS